MRHDIEDEYQPHYILGHAIDWLEDYRRKVEAGIASDDYIVMALESAREFVDSAYAMATFAAHEGDRRSIDGFDSYAVFSPGSSTGTFIPHIRNARICDTMIDIQRRIGLIHLKFMDSINVDNVSSIIDELRKIVEDSRHYTNAYTASS